MLLRVFWILTRRVCGLRLAMTALLRQGRAVQIPGARLRQTVRLTFFFGRTFESFFMNGETRCVKCGGALPPGKAVGRPPRYCSTACRRLAEYEVSRLQSRLSRLEDELLREKHNRSGLKDFSGRDVAARMVDLRADIEHTEARLRELIVAGSPESAR